MNYILELIDRLAGERRLERAEYIKLLRSWHDIDRDYLFALARETVAGVYGRDIFLRGLIEVTNFCKNDCLYCGIRKSNTAVTRYRLDNTRILDRCAHGYTLGLRTFVLQGGEDPGLTDERICTLISDIKRNCPDAAVTLSLGEKPYESYAAYRRAGADRYLLRHETADASHYAALHPPIMSFENRLNCLSDLKSLGYQVGAGFMVGSPGQTAETLAADLLYLQEFQPDMVGIGPFIPHKETPFAAEIAGSVELTLILLAITRLILPDALLPATTALGTLDGNGFERGVLAGANVIMPNLTPPDERARYQLYNGKNSASADDLSVIAGRMAAIGHRTVMGRGDHISMKTPAKTNYDPKSSVAEEFINHEEILDSLACAEENRGNSKLIDEILEKAGELKGLSHRDALVLLDCDIPEKNEVIYKLAEQIKKDFYGNRIVLFAPLYLSNYCVNGCAYCPYHYENLHITRKKLTQDDIRREVVALQDMGHKRLAIEAGEDPVNNPIEYILESIDTIYGIKHKNGAIRRVNVNIAATTVENYRRLKEAGIGTYILFQETYHNESYEQLHPTGPKHNYAYHTTAMDRAMLGGIDDVGLGVLFGLELYRYELAGLLMHAEHLEAVHGVGPHTISVPRICPADDIDPGSFNNSIDDDTFAKIIAVIRIAVPYTGIIMSTREGKAMRARALRLGVSQISGGSRTSVGGYDEPELDDENSRQFDISDCRTLDEVVCWLMEANHIPSFCTACYREGRTGDRFMQLCKSRQIQNCCHPNALLTLQEYLEDYATPETRRIGEELIKRELKNIPSEKVRSIVENNLAGIHGGSRDFRF